MANVQPCCQCTATLDNGNVMGWYGNWNPMHFLLTYELVHDYVEKRAPLRGEHLTLAQKAFDKGELLLAGAMAEPADMAMLVFRGPTADAAKSFAESDPYVKNGLVKAWRVRKWMTVVGDGQQPA